MILGLGARDLVTLAQEARAAGLPRPIHVVGDGAAGLAAALAEGGTPSLVRVTDGAEGASAVVLCLDDPSVAPLALLRGAARSGIPVIVATSRARRVPYVLAEDIVRGTAPVAEAVAERLAAVLGGDAIALAGELPVLREAVLARREAATATAAAWIAARGAGSGPRLPVLSLLQARLLRQLARARGEAPPRAVEATARTVATEVGAALGAGLVARAVVRRLPRTRPLEAVVAYGVTRLLAQMARLAH
ncbi:MAG: hypothetical protein EXQ77_04360 [Thermoleophilia bacterium]|nr:hypothetical protein [Thermoleophilia bacterium]